jgi:hypothetical protein
MINFTKQLGQTVVFLGVCSCAGIPENNTLLYKGVIVDEISRSSLSGAYIDSIEIDENNKRIKYNNGKIIVGLSDCGDSDWYCISDGNLEFAFPIRKGADQNSWEYRQIKYSVMKSDEVAGGNNAYFILAESSTESGKIIAPKIFLYSVGEGILSITKLQGRSLIPTTYVLDR